MNQNECSQAIHDLGVQSAVVRSKGQRSLLRLEFPALYAGVAGHDGGSQPASMAGNEKDNAIVISSTENTPVKRGDTVKHPVTVKMEPGVLNLKKVKIEPGVRAMERASSARADTFKSGVQVKGTAPTYEPPFPSNGSYFPKYDAAAFDAAGYASAEDSDSSNTPSMLDLTVAESPKRAPPAKHRYVDNGDVMAVAAPVIAVGTTPLRAVPSPPVLSSATPVLDPLPSSVTPSGPFLGSSSSIRSLALGEERSPPPSPDGSPLPLWKKARVAGVQAAQVADPAPTVASLFSGGGPFLFGDGK